MVVNIPYMEHMGILITTVNEVYKPTNITGGHHIVGMDSKASQVFSALNSTIFWPSWNREREKVGVHITPITMQYDTQITNWLMGFINQLITGGAHILGFMVDLKIVNGDLLKQPTSLGEIVFMGIFLEQPTWVTCN